MCIRDSSSTVSRKEFLELLRKYDPEPEDVWKVLIGNSVKTTHPLNAEFLHELLISYELNKRDYLWTIYINNVFSDESTRIAQLVQNYTKGEPVVMKSKKQAELLLTLFAWLLTSSDRTFRDCTCLLYTSYRLYGSLFTGYSNRKDRIAAKDTDGFQKSYFNRMINSA